MELEELHKLAENLSEDDWDSLQTIMECRQKPVFLWETYKKYYKLISEYPYLDDWGAFTDQSIMKFGFQNNIFDLWELNEIADSPFYNLVWKYCRAHHWYKVYRNLYKEGDKHTCPFTGKECKSEDECFDGLFTRFSIHRSLLSSHFTFLETCREWHIFPSIEHIEREISRMALQLMEIIPIVENVLYKDSIKWMRETKLIQSEKAFEKLKGRDENKPSCNHWYLTDRYKKRCEKDSTE